MLFRSNGKTIITDSGAPDNGEGTNGDYYFRTDTRGWYFKAGGSWSLQFVMNTVHFVSGAPNDANGVDGDVAVRDNGQFYLKAGGAWGSVQFTALIANGHSDTFYAANAEGGSTTKLITVEEGQVVP